MVKGDARKNREEMLRETKEQLSSASAQVQAGSSKELGHSI